MITNHKLAKSAYCLVLPNHIISHGKNTKGYSANFENWSLKNTGIVVL